MARYLIFGDISSPHLTKWIKELKSKYELYVVSFITEEIKSSDELLPRENIFTIKISRKQQGGNLNLLKYIPAVYQIIKKIKPNFVNAHYITSYGFIAAFIKTCLFCNFKLILSAWGSDILVTPKKNKLYYLITSWTLKQADLITSDSFHMSDEIYLIAKRQSITFPFGVDNVSPVGMTDKEGFLIFSNRALSPNYNIDKVIELFCKLLEYKPELTMIIANSGPDREKLVSLTKSLNVYDKIKFVGYLTKRQQEEYYQKSMYYISIPKSDATSVSLLEAMSYGCIPIVSNIPANREWVLSGVNGYYLNDTLDNMERMFDQERIRQQFFINRQLILEKAIWKNNIKRMLEKIANESEQL